MPFCKRPILAGQEPSISSISMKNLVIINDLSEASGGASALAIRSAFAMCERGFQVTFIAGDAGSNARLKAAGVELLGLGRSRLLASHPARALVDGIYNRAAERLVSGWISENDTPETIYHLHGWAQILSPSMFSALEPVRDRLVLSAHDFFLACPTGSFSFPSGEPCQLVPLSRACLVSDCDRRNYAHKLWRVARQAVQRHFYQPRRSPPVLAVHERMRPYLCRVGIPSESIIALPNPIHAFCDTRIPAEQNSELLFVGRLEDTKGADLALAAARKASATLRLVGDGARGAALRAAYPEMIFTGFVEPAAIARQSRHARLLLMPSRYPEPFGMVAAEALWSGLPVILPTTALLAEEVVAADAGVALEPRDTDGFAATIASLLGDDQRIREMSFNALNGTRTIGLQDSEWLDRLESIYGARLAGDVLLSGLATPSFRPRDSAP
jgi:glycosyltransferase involved in cell wall biosynthesis